MRTIFVVLLVSLWTCSTYSQQTAEPKVSYDDISYPQYQYAVSISSLHELNFKSLKVFWFAGKEPESGTKLRNGAFQRKSTDKRYEKVNLDLVAFIDSPDGKAQHSVIDLEWWDCGGSCTVVGRVQVFELQARHPTVVQEIEYDRHAPGTGVQFDTRTQTLTITGRSNDHTPNCCPKSLDVMRFVWGGKRFVFADSKTIAAAKASLP